MGPREECFDAVVVGAGPAGATASTIIALRGHRVLLLEKETLPLYKVGESLLPSTIHGICSILGVTEELKAANFVHKLGGTFRWGKNKEPWTFSFAASSEFDGPTSHAYQVERMKFDKILVDNARRKGVDVREQHAVSDVIVEDDRVVGVQVTDDRGQPVTVRAKYVLDGSGHGTWLAKHVGKRVDSKFFRNLAVFGYFRNGKRLPPPRSGNIFCAAFEKGWIWYIPLSSELTSVGVVIGQEHAGVLHKDKQVAFAELLDQCEPIRELLTDAQRVTEGPYGEVRVRKDFSYCHTAFWRPGLALIGDAACFIDPVFSSGVHLATYSGLLAARSVNTWLAGGVSEQRAFTEFQNRYLREYKYFHDFLVAFYDLEQDLDSYYWSARKVLSAPDAGAEAFIRLVGGIGTGEKLSAGSRAAAPTSELSKHLFPGAFGASDMYMDGDESSDGRYGDAELRDAFMQNLTAEAVQMQSQAIGVPMQSRPMFENGLVPSADGFEWAVPAPPRVFRRAPVLVAR
ncbi:MAG TPA: tryptophan 7-halogenase [Vicinamibacterales bacterium]|nr:tryptophan 7-halogenase [Vicinamibacterales bacterium]